ncbi:MAG TPA: hypothetical protein VGN07_14455 [Steroidobacteraceae bacterium]|jgi:hypothetical protein
MNPLKSLLALWCRHRRNRGLKLRDFRRARQRGNAMLETVVALLGLMPLLIGIPLLGKQLDVKQKTYDTARYVVWERTVWSSDGLSNRKSDADIALESRDRTLGDPRAGLLAVESIRSAGVTENLLWRDRRGQRLLDYDHETSPFAVAQRQQNSPIEVGYTLVPGITYGDGPLRVLEDALQLHDLHFNRQSFTNGSVSIGLRAVLPQIADRAVSVGVRAEPKDIRHSLVQTAGGAVLSDTWSVRDESSLRNKVDELTTNELVQSLELAGRPIAMQALGKGHSLYGEGQFGWDADLRPRSEVLPAAYISPPR